MRRGAFTLMEVLVSVVILVLITVYMYGAMAGSRTTMGALKRGSEAEHNRTMLYTLLFRDIMEADSVKSVSTENRRYHLLQLQTRNSLYDMPAPYVLWYVNAQSKSLVRLESSREISLPIGYDDRVYVHADVFAKEVTDFNLYVQNTTQQSEENNDSLSSADDDNTSLVDKSSIRRYLLYLNAPKMKEMLMEVAK